MDSLLEILDNGAQRGARSVPVLMPVALDQTYDYLVPDGVDAAPGAFVLVPFGPQTRIGIVWDGPRGEAASPSTDKKLKSLTSRIDAPPLPEISMRFAEWVARYTLAPLGMVVRMMMGADAAFEPPKPASAFASSKVRPHPPQMTPARNARWASRQMVWFAPNPIWPLGRLLDGRH